MINNSYTTAIENIHAPEYAVENAIRTAEIRAAQINSNRIKVRYTAAAASVVLAGAAGLYFYNMFGQDKPGFDPPIVPSAVTVTEESSEASETVIDSEAKDVKAAETVSAADSSVSATETVTKETEAAAESINAETVPDKQAETEIDPPAVKPSEKPAEEPAEKATDPHEQTEPEYVEVQPIDVEVDSSQLGDDGKLYCMIAETAYDVVNDPDAFSDSHVYYVETKFGRYRQWFDYGAVYRDEMSKKKYVFYNSDGVVLYTEPLSTN